MKKILARADTVRLSIVRTEELLRLLHTQPCKVRKEMDTISQSNRSHYRQMSPASWIDDEVDVLITLKQRLKEVEDESCTNIRSRDNDKDIQQTQSISLLSRQLGGSCWV